MKQDIAVQVEGLSKNFKLPHEKVNSVKGLFTSIIKSNPFRTKSYEVQYALQDIDFSVKRGEFFGVVGRNGSGKSTLLRILAGIYLPTKGKVTVSGRLVPFIELGLGFHSDLTGRENVFLNGALLGYSEKEVAEKYQKIVDFAEIERFMDQKLKNYSSGMQVRLAFSVATILAESDILLIDEVLAVGDTKFQQKCYEYFHSLRESNKTVIFVTHDMDAIKEYCHRALIINKSKVLKIGTPEEIAKIYKETVGLNPI